MDLGSEASALESVDDNHVIQDTTTIQHHSDHDHDGLDHGNSYKDHNGTSPNQYRVELVQNSSQSPPVRKGYGLKKWRRIKRSSPNQNAPAEPEPEADSEAQEDNGKVLKRRGFPSASIPPAKPSQSSSLEINQNALGNVFNSLNDVGQSESGSSLDSRFAFGAPSDSENSEGRNSRSSTAASAPKAVMHASPVVLGHGRMKNLVAKIAGNSNQKVHSGKSVASENNKKQRGEKIKIDKEDSQSSLESDSRSSNFVFTKGVSSSTTSNGRSKNFCGENIDEELFGDGVQTAFRKENVDETEEVNDLTKDSSWKDKKGKGENHHGSPVHDSLTESIRALQSVQEALEKEVHNLGEVGKEPISLHANSVIENGVSLETTDWLSSEKNGEKASRTLENQVSTLTQKVNFLESRLEEAKAAIELKETRVAELEATIKSPKSTKEESGSSVEFQEMELEFECLFLQKLEAEIEYLAIAKATEKLRIAATDHRKLFEEQKSIMSNQGQVLSHLGEAEQKAAVVKKQVEKIEQYCEDIISTEESLKMQRRACKLTFSFFIQFILLLLVFWFVVLDSSYPQSGVIVPT